MQPPPTQAERVAAVLEALSPTAATGEGGGEDPIIVLEENPRVSVQGCGVSSPESGCERR